MTRGEWDFSRGFVIVAAVLIGIGFVAGFAFGFFIWGVR